jgi:zinc transport system ATP-binding protein
MKTPLPSPAVIDLEHVSFSIGGLSVLENVSLAVQEHDFLCMVGPNAGGKTTLLKLVLGLLRPTGGTVRVFGGPPAKSRFRIGYMPQHASLDPLFPVSVLDVVLLGRLQGGFRFGPYRKRDREAAGQALETLKLHGVRHRPFSELSGGQRQRVLIARALVSSPDLLLLDEPTANVDAVLESELFEVLNRLNEKMTIVLVTHDLGFVSRYVKRVACVNRRVAVHQTSEITGEMIHEIYGSDVRMVRHDTVGPSGGRDR